MDWEDVKSYAKKAGARFPECVAAQWALESGYGKHVSGKYNYFGIKSSEGTILHTKEFIGGEEVTILDTFKDFANAYECIEYLVSRWYLDYNNGEVSYKGVNRATSKEACARLLQYEGYATDPLYAEKLLEIMEKNQDLTEESFLERAAIYYTGEAHQIAAWRALEKNLDADTLDNFIASYRGSQAAYTHQVENDTKSMLLDVPYFYQKDSTTGHGERMCFSSSMAMALDFWDPDAIDGDDDWYLEQVLKYGDTVSSVAQITAARSLGFDVRFHMDGSVEDLEALLANDIPVPIGILHKGTLDHPVGGGHWVCVVGSSGNSFVVHDPFGELDLVNGAYIKSGPTDGKFVYYDKRNLAKRWTVQGKNDGWYVEIR
jgi:hypothetical protein